MMTQHHLQLHRQLRGNGNGSCRFGRGSRSKLRSWLELKKVIAQENCQGIDLSSQLIQHSKLHTNFMTGLRWIGDELVQQRRNFTLLVPSGYFKGCIVFATSQVLSFLVLDVSEVSATGNEPLNHFMLSISRCKPQWSASFGVFECDIDTRILQQLNNRHTAKRTT